MSRGWVLAGGVVVGLGALWLLSRDGSPLAGVLGSLAGGAGGAGGSKGFAPNGSKTGDGGTNFAGHTYYDPTTTALIDATLEHQRDPSTHTGGEVLGYFNGFRITDSVQAAWLDAHAAAGTWVRV